MLARRCFDVRCDAWQHDDNEIGASFNFRDLIILACDFAAYELDAQSQRIR